MTELPAFPKALSPDLLCTCTDPAIFTFKTTADLEPLDEIIGQNRAVEAVCFAVGMTGDGYNLFALGPEGIGKQSLVEGVLADRAATGPVPDDWCYINNFKEPHLPRALRLPPGKGRPLCQDMEHLVVDLKTAIPAAFEGEEFRKQKEAIEEELKSKNEMDFSSLQKRAARSDVALLRTPVGLVLAPVADGEVLSNEQFEKLPKKDRKRRVDAMETLQEELEEIIHSIPKREKQSREQIRELVRRIMQLAVGHQIEELKKRWNGLPDVLEYFDSVSRDVVDNAGDFMSQDQGTGGRESMTLGGQSAAAGNASFRRYRVNVMVDNSELMTSEAPVGAPVVMEDHPTQPNLIGRIDHMSQFGTLTTDFTMVKPGALHAANGGYLILDVRKVLMQPFAWETLMRTLKSGHIRIESLGESVGWVSTVTLQPEPIPLRVKVVLLGEPRLYYLLMALDPEFRELFKVAADFDSRMDRDEGTAQNYARLIAGLARREGLRAMNSAAVARVVDEGARQTGDAEKVTTHMASVVDLVREADYWADEDTADVIDFRHVQKAIEAKDYRSDRIRERVQEEIERGTIRIETDGVIIGQINALSVIQLDHFAFGRPSRVSCRVRMGKGIVIDIEREVELGGPLHSKGVMILSSFVESTYTGDFPLSLSASLVFEQSYGGVDGDSASSTELYALLSALAEVPIKQSLAVTGSVDQLGRIQAIGGVNEKIEGFFDVCTRRGLTGEQGVLIPASNVTHLMLRDDVVEAARDGKFHIYPVATIDQGIALLTGIEAGIADDKGEFPLGSVNRAVAKRLKDFAMTSASFAKKVVDGLT